MEGYFTFYPELKWTVIFPAQAYTGLDKLKDNLVTPYTMDFTLERFQDLRKLPLREQKMFGKLKLIGNNKIIVFIDGSDSRLDELIKRLPKYKGKSWPEINNMRFERDFLNCKNFETSLCNPQLLDIREFKPIIPGQEVNELDYTKADEICTKCEYFDPK